MPWRRGRSNLSPHDQLGGSARVARLFAVYGTGFVLMALTMAALFADARRNAKLDPAGLAHSKGEVGIWLIPAATGIISILLSLTRFGALAAFAYSTLPLSIWLFASRFDWSRGAAEE